MGNDMKKIGILTIVLFVMISPLMLYSQDKGYGWPIYRGDQMLSGVARGSLPDRMKLLWTFETEDEIRSSAVIGNGMVFIGSYDGRVYALDLINGKKIWGFDTENAVEAPPLLVKDTLYAGSLSGVLCA